MQGKGELHGGRVVHRNHWGEHSGRAEVNIQPIHAW
jgi:hypothetical protein